MRRPSRPRHDPSGPRGPAPEAAPQRTVAGLVATAALFVGALLALANPLAMGALAVAALTVAFLRRVAGRRERPERVPQGCAQGTDACAEA